MKQLILLLLCLALGTTAWAQQNAEQVGEPQDSLTFTGKITNDEYQVWIEMDFYLKNIACPGQEIFGENPGYLGARRDSRKWIILDAEPQGCTAQLTIINDYGSDDLTATLTFNPKDGSYLLEQKTGSTMRIAVNNKWVKLPKRMVFERKKK